MVLWFRCLRHRTAKPVVHPPLGTGTCDFYSDCLEDAKSCGSEGYAIGYGERYCERFSSRTDFSLKGSEWRDATLVCLQKSLVETSQNLRLGIDISCETITDTAFDSHPACYTQVGKSVCDLGLSDLSVIYDVIDAGDVLSLRGLRQAVAVADTCIFGLSVERYAQSRSLRRFNTDPDFDVEARLEFWRRLKKEAIEQ
ncbi:MAG: hypothetical protein HRU19_23090 [Pseudobacteriovorax sp.]|nr:hypothetical protein [Pseudobacteriovorax sp.]